MLRNLFLVSLALAAIASGDAVKEKAAADAYAKKEYAAALTLYKQLVVEDPKSARFRYRLAFCEFVTDDLAAAEKDFRKALEMGSPGSFVNYNLACLHSRQGKKAEAIKELEAAHKAGFSNIDQLKGDADFEPIRKEPGYLKLAEKIEFPLKGVAGADALDHWVGEWSVTANGAPAGENSIVKVLKGYGVTEHWRSANGQQGMSLFAFDIENKVWRHIWTSEDGWTVVRTGKPVKDGIYFEGTSVQPGQKGQETREWITKNPDGTVRQLIESLDAKTKKWTVVFDGIYKRKV